MIQRARSSLAVALVRVGEFYGALTRGPRLSRRAARCCFHCINNVEMGQCKTLLIISKLCTHCESSQLADDSSYERVQCYKSTKLTPSRILEAFVLGI